MFPLSALAGTSINDTTSVTFDPYADLRKTATNNISVKSASPLSLEAILPIILIGAIVLLVWKLFK